MHMRVFIYVKNFDCKQTQLCDDEIAHVHFKASQSINLHMCHIIGLRLIIDQDSPKYMWQRVSARLYNQILNSFKFKIRINKAILKRMETKNTKEYLGYQFVKNVQTVIVKPNY